MRLHIIFTVPSNFFGTIEMLTVGNYTDRALEKATLEVLTEELPDELDGDFDSCEAVNGTLAELYAIDLDTGEEYDDPSQVGVDTDARNLVDSLLWDRHYRTATAVAERLVREGFAAVSYPALETATNVRVDDLLSLANSEVAGLARMVTAAKAVSTHHVTIGSNADRGYLDSHRRWHVGVRSLDGDMHRFFKTAGFLAPEAQVADAVERFNSDDIAFPVDKTSRLATTG